MSWHPNSNKHKASHGGYKKKPCRHEVNALLDFYSKATTLKTVQQASKEEIGTQLKLKF